SHSDITCNPRPPTATDPLSLHDALPICHKYKRFYLRELGFRIHEFKPYPEDAPIQVAATGALGPDETIRLPLFGSGSAGSASGPDRESTRLNSSHVKISYAVFCLTKRKT